MPRVRPLTGFVAWDATGGSGQLCGRLLADLGMEVWCVEDLGVDITAVQEPTVKTAEGAVSLPFEFLNAGKLSLPREALDRRGASDANEPTASPFDVLILDQSESDAAISERVLKDFLEESVPKPIVVNIANFGRSGPYAEFAATDMTLYALGGLLYISGDPDLPPCAPPEPLGGYFACVWAAVGALAALWRRRTDGDGDSVEVSIHETIASQEQLIRFGGHHGTNIERQGSQHKHISPGNVYPTLDGFVYLFVNRKHWPVFLGLWDGHPGFLESPPWDSQEYRRANHLELDQLIGEWTSTLQSEMLVDLMQRGGVPALRVNAPTDVLNDDHLESRNFFASVEHPVLGSFRQPTLPFTVDGMRLPPRSGSRVGRQSRPSG